jgi:hypothetical protein
MPRACPVPSFISSDRGAARHLTPRVVEPSGLDKRRHGPKMPSMAAGDRDTKDTGRLSAWFGGLSRSVKILIAVAAAVGTIGSAITVTGQAATWWTNHTARPTPPTPQSEFLNTPKLGLQFWQGGQQARMSSLQAGGEEGVQVFLKRSALEIWFPSVGTQTEIQVLAWTDNSIFSIKRDGDINNSPAFHPGTGIADSAFGSGTLFVNNEAHNALYGDRIRPAANGMQKIYVSNLWSPSDTHGIPIGASHGQLYLTVYIDKNQDHRFAFDDYEYIVLQFD